MMKSTLLIFSFIILGLFNVSAQESKKAETTSSISALTLIENAILEAEEDDKGITLIKAERSLVDLKTAYVENKSQNAVDKKAVLSSLTQDRNYNDLVKQADIAKLEKEEYLIKMNPDYAKLLADEKEAVKEKYASNKVDRSTRAAKKKTMMGGNNGRIKTKPTTKRKGIVKNAKVLSPKKK